MKFFAMILFLSINAVAADSWRQIGCASDPMSSAKPQLIKQSSCGDTICLMPEVCSWVWAPYLEEHGLMSGKRFIDAAVMSEVPVKYQNVTRGYAICTAVDGHCPSLAKCGAPDSKFDIKEDVNPAMTLLPGVGTVSPATTPAAPAATGEK